MQNLLVVTKITIPLPNKQQNNCDMKNITLKIGNQIFKSYEEYERAYIKKWESLNKSVIDLNWIKNDWKTRISNPELYK